MFKVSKYILLFGALLSVSLIAETRPNILYINVDDLGWGELGYTGSKFYESPQIDKLAAQSMIFTAGYAPSSNCAPSRAACQTGQWAPRTGVYTICRVMLQELLISVTISHGKTTTKNRST